MRRWLTPTSAIWVILHILIVLIGLLLMHLPIVLQELGEETASAVGTSVLATGIVGILLFLYVAVSEQTRARLEVLRDAGLIEAFPSRSVTIRDQYERRLKSARRIDVIGYGLGSFREDFIAKFPEWSQRAKIRIVAVDPAAPGGSSYADLRDVEEGRTPGKTRDDVTALLSGFKQLNGVNNRNLEVRLATSIPSINLMIIDNEVLWGPYLVGEQSRNTFTLIAKNGGYIYSALEKHFELIWTSYSREPDYE